MSEPLRVLFVEDREDDALLVQRELSRGGYHVFAVRVDTREAMQEQLTHSSWDLIISDYSMPQFSAVGSLEVLQASGLDLPFIIVSGTVGEDVAVAALKAGAHDFIPKGNLRRLVPAVARELREAASRRERRRAEAQLRHTNEVIAAALGASPVPMILLDPDGKVARWNRAAEHVFGWQAAEVLGNSLPTIPADQQQDFTALLAHVLAGTPLVNHEVTRVRKDGAILNLLVNAAPIYNGNEIAAVISILVDLTEQRSLEEQFRQAQKMEAVGRLAGGIAHDFNNVLTAIHGYASLLFDAGLEDERQADVLEIMRAAERAASFTRQLLAFSRKQVTQPTLIDTNQLLRDLTRLLQRVIGDNIAFTVDLSDEPQHVVADKGQLEQVIINLVVNARDAVDAAGTGAIRLKNHCREVSTALAAQYDVRPGSFCVIDVTDNGSGIAAEDLQRIFEPFFTTKEVGKGTGLGLATVYGIVRQLGGMVQVETELGRGSTFSVYLPQAPSAQEEAPPPTETPTGMARDRLSVMVVEDEPAIRQLIARILNRAGHEPHLAANPHEALDMLRKAGHLDLLLTDLMLPHMNGQELAARVQAERPEITVLLISGYAEHQIDVDAAFLEKPFSPADLLRKIRELFPLSA